MLVAIERKKGSSSGFCATVITLLRRRRAAAFGLDVHGTLSGYSFSGVPCGGDGAGRERELYRAADEVKIRVIALSYRVTVDDDDRTKRRLIASVTRL